MADGLRFRRGDLLALGLVLAAAAALAAVLLLRAAPGAEARVYLDGKLLAVLPLDRDAVYEAAGTYVNTITVRNGAVAVTASDCPGNDCVHSGWISAAGRSIVCLPNRLEVRITGGAGDGVDAVTGLGGGR